ncbi:hypothetical protein [Thermoleptolyngbya sp. M55_K2018_002]|uniref:hypothetical protein n=1 Tax=Thermoleptolyngbya sp. M55_K2018_002 TaxID=2747808 RepID=UPI001A028F8C|nr:hypothetical protein [Thermoleptolyngbya sp. M55_K2018_002]HIK42979.1 hypothetical protein [Thermoleptolyngbya sp. M55_K2018_002]
MQKLRLVVRNASLLVLLGLSMAAGRIGLSPLDPASAHQVQVSGEVGGTVHIEPRDNPRAGVASQAWFALARRGGQTIPLSACTCQLEVYARPRRQGDAPILSPTLQAVSAEGRQGIPGATVTFPRAGAYELVLRGRPVTSGTFTPFELRFPVTVAR